MLSWTTARASDVNGVQPSPIPDRQAEQHRREHDDQQAGAEPGVVEDGVHHWPTVAARGPRTASIVGWR